MKAADRTQVFMTMAYIAALASKDERTKIGSLLIGPDNEIRSAGYNGLPRGCCDDFDYRQKAPEKYYWFSHAEQNSILNAARVGIPTKSCTLYTMAHPCADCARAIIQAGITKVVIHKQYTERMDSEKWKESFLRAQEMFDEAKVEVVVWDGELLLPDAVCNGEVTTYRYFTNA